MRIDIISVVPELMTSPLSESILKRAQEKGLVEIVVHNLHDYAHDKRKTTDDYPFGGEAGMVMQIEPIDRAISALKAERDYDEINPWDHLDYLITKEFLVRENKTAHNETTTPNCREKCSGCGANKLGGKNRWCK